MFIAKLPFSIRVLLESAIRNLDEFTVKSADIETILDWKVNASKKAEIPFKPARVILQDFTGVPSVVDLAAMRDAIVRMGGKAEDINPLCPVDLVIDHSVQVDVARTGGALEKNEEIEFKRNYERFEFLKWGSTAFKNLRIVPPGSGIVHQVNLEYLARVVFDTADVLYPDSLVGTDSHTTMVNGLGCTGWGVGGIEAESVMLGQLISMVLPEVVGFKLVGKLNPNVMATDLVLTVVQMLRKRGVVGKFVEFFGPGIQNLSLPDRATISNMSPEYGATMGFFPVDEVTLGYMALSGRSAKKIAVTEAYLRAQGLFRLYDGSQPTPDYSGDILELDLSTVVLSIAGPKLPHDRVDVSGQKADWSSCLTAPIGSKGYNQTPEQTDSHGSFELDGKSYEIRNGSVVIAAITSCTNTSNPEVLLWAGLVAQRAVAKGMTLLPYIKTSLSPGSKVVTMYLKEAGLLEPLEKLGFNLAGYGCMTCIGNSGSLPESMEKCIVENNIIATNVLSGNRNFEGRVHQYTRASYLASPPLVVAYALAGTMNIDLKKDPLGKDSNGADVFFKDLWPSRSEVQAILSKTVSVEQFKKVYKDISKGTENWNNLKVTKTSVYNWNPESTYIHDPPFFANTTKEMPVIGDIKGAYCLMNLGDAVTTDHISPAGAIAKKSPAGEYLLGKGVAKRDFNTYGSRRGNDLVMARGTFANIRIVNKLCEKTGAWTTHIPSGDVVSPFEASKRYLEKKESMIVMGGKLYGNGSSRDWAAKGPYLMGVSAVIAESFERIHRSNLLGMGILPLEFLPGEGADQLGLTGKERFNICLKGGDISVMQKLEVTANDKKFTVVVRLDTEPEVLFWKSGGILNYVLREMAK